MYVDEDGNPIYGMEDMDMDDMEGMDEDMEMNSYGH